MWTSVDGGNVREDPTYTCYAEAVVEGKTSGMLAALLEEWAYA